MRSGIGIRIVPGLFEARGYVQLPSPQSANILILSSFLPGRIICSNSRANILKPRILEAGFVVPPIPRRLTAVGKKLGLWRVASRLLAVSLALISAVPVNAARADSSELAGGWHFVRTRNPRGGADAVSVMRTADTSRSDVDLVGLMIRCREAGTEIVIVVLRSFPLRAQPSVVFGEPGRETRFKATIAAPGTAILLPGDASAIVRGSWDNLNDLFIRVEDGQSTICGVIHVDGLQGAFKALAANCPAP